MRAHPHWTAAGAIALLFAVTGGCGGSTTGRFPAAKGRSLHAVFKGAKQGPILAPSVGVLHPGAVNRFGFGLFDRSRRQLTGAPVAVYVAAADGSAASGPYPARAESLAVAPAFQARTTAADPDAAKSVYVADVPLPRARQATLVAVRRIGGRLVASGAQIVDLGVPGPPPVGAAAVKVHTPTSPPTPIASIETRIPPDMMHRTDLAGALGHRPVLLVFATPQLCQSRVCGPIVDEAAQLQSVYGRRMAFIHMEIYKDNQIAKGNTPQVTAWRLPSEPWTFAIDRRGRIAAELEGAASVNEMRQAIEEALAP